MVLLQKELTRMGILEFRVKATIDGSLEDPFGGSKSEDLKSPLLFKFYYYYLN